MPRLLPSSVASDAGSKGAAASPVATIETYQIYDIHRFYRGEYFGVEGMLHDQSMMVRWLRLALIDLLYGQLDHFKSSPIRGVPPFISPISSAFLHHDDDCR
jgi:hypothetical protein